MLLLSEAILEPSDTERNHRLCRYFQPRYHCLEVSLCICGLWHPYFYYLYVPPYLALCEIVLLRNLFTKIPMATLVWPGRTPMGENGGFGLR